VEAPQSPEIVPRPAATLLVVRDQPSGSHEGADGGHSTQVEVLMVRRTATAVFYAGAHVFPGGALEPIDSDPGAHALVTGVIADDANRLLGVHANALAYWLGAVRECFEETGLLVAATLRGRDPGEDAAFAGLCDALREEDGSAEDLFTLCQKEGVTFAFGDVAYFGHRITPPGGSRRFDTRFFVARAPSGQRARADASETFDAIWLAPNEALRRFESAEMQLAPPTVTCLRTVGGFADTGSLVAAVAGRAGIGVPLMGPQAPSD
jgi:8-oxo-dGTP pyrophosphatase MutT (NUDIX family)